MSPWGRSYQDEFLDEPPVVRSYLGYMMARPDSIVAAIREIACADGSVLVHCAAGKDRTGTVVALALDAAGVSREWIANTNYPRYGQADRSDHRPAAPAPTPTALKLIQGTTRRTMRRCRERSSASSRARRLAHLGGAVGWLPLVNGLHRWELARLRERLRPALQA